MDPENNEYKYFWVIYKTLNGEQGESLVTSPPFTSLDEVETWCDKNDIPEKRIITRTKTKRYPVKMSDILRHKVDV